MYYKDHKKYKKGMIGTSLYRRRKYKTFVYVIGFILLFIVVRTLLKNHNSKQTLIRENNDEQYKQEIHNIIKQYKKDIPETNDISMDEFVNLYFKSNELFLLVDARTDEERKVSIIPRSISKEEYFERYKDENIPPIRVFFYSTIGKRSRELTHQETSRGVFATSVNGGIVEWTHFNKPLVTLDGQNTRKVHVYSKEYSLVSHNYQPVY